MLVRLRGGALALVVLVMPACQVIGGFKSFTGSSVASGGGGGTAGTTGGTANGGASSGGGQSGGAGGGGTSGSGGTTSSNPCPNEADPGKHGPKMAEVARPDGSCFWIDSTEVTVADYQQFLGVSPAPKQDGVCAWNTGTGAPPANSYPGFVPPASCVANIPGGLALDGGLTATSDRFGASVSLSGATAIVGAPGETVGVHAGQGSAHVYAQSGTAWTHQQTLTVAGGLAGDAFGSSVAVSGTAALVGAPGATVSLNAGEGAVYVFAESGTTWGQPTKLTASGGKAGDHLGCSSSISPSGTEAFVGASGADLAQGAAYVFSRSGSGPWGPVQTIVAADGSASDALGTSVSVSDTVAVVAAPGRTFGAHVGAGSAYVFTPTGTTWTQQTEIAATDGAASDAFGTSVSVSGTTIVIGAPGHGVGEGAVYVFVQTAPAAWTQQAELVASDGAANAAFGTSVSISGDTVVVGASSAAVGAHPGQGVAYVFAPTSTPGEWAQVAELRASDGAAQDSLGTSVASNGTTALVGASRDPGGAKLGPGYAYAFMGTEDGGAMSAQRLAASDGATAPSSNEPVSCVDWCDALAYCVWAGKDLCRDAGGTSSGSTSDWYQACSEGNAKNVYSCGGACESSVCNGASSGNNAILPVGAETSCVVSSANGVSIDDLSGNVSEWTNYCILDTNTGACTARGGGFQSSDSALACAAVTDQLTRIAIQPDLGFRCCADAHATDGG